MAENIIGTAALEVRTNFVSANTDLTRRLDAQAHATAADLHDGDFDFISNADGFADFPGEDEHVLPLSLTSDVPSLE